MVSTGPTESLNRLRNFVTNDNSFAPLWKSDWAAGRAIGRLIVMPEKTLHIAPDLTGRFRFDPRQP